MSLERRVSANDWRRWTLNEEEFCLRSTLQALDLLFFCCVFCVCLIVWVAPCGTCNYNNSAFGFGIRTAAWNRSWRCKGSGDSGSTQMRCDQSGLLLQSPLRWHSTSHLYFSYLLVLYFVSQIMNHFIFFNDIYLFLWYFLHTCMSALNGEALLSHCVCGNLCLVTIKAFYSILLSSKWAGQSCIVNPAAAGQHLH